MKKIKFPLKDMTFLIPLRVDSIVRIENMLMSIRYLLNNFDTNVHVLHSSAYDNGILHRVLDKSVRYSFIEDYDTIFYRTKYLNQMTLSATTPFVAIWDTDVIIDKNQIIDSIIKLREGCDIAYPYDGHFYDTTDIIRDLFYKTGNIKILYQNQAKMGLIYGSDTKGGAIFVNRDSYIKAGMENENFYGWGPEDFERYDRWKILEYGIYHSKGCLFHLSHPRGNNSTFRSFDQMVNTNRELTKTRGSSKYEIKCVLETLKMRSNSTVDKSKIHR